MSKADREVTIQELKDMIRQYCEERDWQKRQTPRSLASSITIEAAELLEHFQWDESPADDKEAIADELADILFYCMNFANVMDIDVATAYNRKLEKARNKYPLEIFQDGKGDLKTYKDIQQSVRKADK